MLLFVHRCATHSCLQHVAQHQFFLSWVLSIISKGGNPTASLGNLFAISMSKILSNNERQEAKSKEIKLSLLEKLLYL